MSALLTMLKSSGAGHARLLAGPILIVMVLGMMVLPCPRSCWTCCSPSTLRCP